MFTIVASSTTISCAMPRTARIAQRRAWWGFWGVIQAFGGGSGEVFSTFDRQIVAQSGASTSISDYRWCYDYVSPSPLRARRRAQPPAHPGRRRRALRRARAGRHARRHRPPRGRRRRHRLPALPRQGGADRRAVRGAHRRRSARPPRRRSTIADPWDGLVLFFERGGELQARDRGLKELHRRPRPRRRVPDPRPRPAARAGHRALRPREGRGRRARRRRGRWTRR